MAASRLPIAALALLACSGCGPFSTLDPAGPQARELGTLGWWLIALSVVTTVVMTALVIGGAVRRRGLLSEHLPLDAGGGMRWVWLGTALPGLVLVALFIATLGTLKAIPGTEEAADLEIHVTAHQWWWQVDYLGRNLPERFSTANEIHIPVGKKVGIRLTSNDVIHSFWVPRLQGKLDAIPGHTNRLVLQADEPGTYRGECAEYCGAQHAHMQFLVIAQSQDAYEDWAARQRRPARTPESPLLARGKAIFEQSACALCHSVRGTQARGGVAPDLTHFGSRQMIAGTLPNRRGPLQAWIINAPAIKPGVRMPAFDRYDGESLNALTAYVESLE